MSCRAAVQRDRGAAHCLSAEQIATFLDLARAGDEATFKALARCLGVRLDVVHEFWTGMVARLGPRRNRGGRFGGG